MDNENKKLDRIEQVTIENEMRESYLAYSMSVIIGRAIPDIRDGLKPVHRRTLFSLHQTATQYNKPYKKSARIVGDVIGKYHPHGDQAVYDTLVRMAQTFSLRYPLVDGQGNFGSIDGDPPAAMRYTEVRLQKISNELLGDLEKKTVDFIPNYDGSLSEPEIFPALLPVLLINGSSGIAVGMATSIPPHNIEEVINAFVYFVNNRDTSILELLNIIKGPDFPTGGFIYGRESIRSAYETGRGTVLVRSKADIETDKSGKQKIIITEIPYQTNKARILENIAHLVKIKKVEGISDLRDESDRDGMRIVVEIKRDEIAEVVLNSLFKFTQLQATFSINLLAIVNKQPKQFNLIDYFNNFLGHRKEVIRRRSLFELEKAERRAHIIEGLKIALDQLDLVIKIIRGSANKEQAKIELMDKLPLSALQTTAILEMQLYKLTGLEIEKLEAEYQELMKLINYLRELLSNEQMMIDLIVEELEKVKETYTDKRRTVIIDHELLDINKEDLIKDEDFVILFTKEGYIKRTTLSSYKSQNRGTMGKRGFGLKDKDMIFKVFVATGRGKPINRIIGITEEEKVCSVIRVRTFDEDKFIMLFSKKGFVKKMPLSSFSRPRTNGIIVAKVPEDDTLFEARITGGDNEVILGTNLGKAIKFNEKNVRPIGRNARGVTGIRMSKEDYLVGADVINEDNNTILTVTENGIGKKSDLSLYRLQSRGGKGVINMKINEKTGKVIGLVTLRDDDDLILSSKNGVLNKQSSTQIRAQGRATQGVRILKLRKGDMLVSITNIDAITAPDEEDIVENGEKE